MAIALIAPGLASACTIPPPPGPKRGETRAAFDARIEAEARARERRIFDGATIAVLVERTARSDHTLTWLRPITMLKGPQLTQPFAISTAADTCGGNGRALAAASPPGKRFVALLSSTRPGDDSLIVLYDPIWLRDPVLMALLPRT